MLNLNDYGIRQGVIQTKEIQAVLDEATQKGGLTVVIPRGEYLTGTLNLGAASLYFEKGAILRGSGDWNDYYPNGFAHNEMHDCISLLYSMGHDDISIGGYGTIDMNAAAFYDMNAPEIPNDGNVYSPEQKDQCTRKYQLRPTQPVFFHNCKNITVEKLTFTNAPCWTMSFNSCENIRITDLTILNDTTIPNNDGIHFCSCKNIIIRGCSIKAGDDCIALSGITDWDKPCENVTISDCIMMSCSKAVSIGYMHSIIRNVTISNCVIYGSQRGISLMSSKGTGLIEHILIQNVRIETMIHAGSWWGNGEPICLNGLFHHNSGYLHAVPDRNFSVNMNDIHFMNISCSAENLIAVIGDENNIRNIYFDGISFEMLESKNRYLKGDRCIDMSPASEKINVPEHFTGIIYSQNCENIRIQNLCVHPHNSEAED